MRSFTFVVAALSFGALHCTVTAGGQPPAPAPTVSAQQACTDYSTALCAKMDQCRFNSTTSTYQNVGTCIAEQVSGCLAAQASPGDGNTAEGTEACAVALPAATCDDYLQNNLTMCPQHSGSLANGSGCYYNSQCQTGFCALSAGVACGACAPQPQPGDECLDHGCARDQTCSPQKVCEHYVATDGVCDKLTQICVPADVCVIASGATTGTCQALITTQGASCDPKHQTGPTCASNAGLYCSSSSMCVAIAYVQPGDACGVQDGGVGDNVCTNASGCFASTCVANANPGEGCDTALGPNCFAGSRCVTDGVGTAGMCTVIDASTCM